MVFRRRTAAVLLAMTLGCEGSLTSHETDQGGANGDGSGWTGGGGGWTDGNGGSGGTGGGWGDGSNNGGGTGGGSNNGGGWGDGSGNGGTGGTGGTGGGTGGSGSNDGGWGGGGSNGGTGGGGPGDGSGDDWGDGSGDDWGDDSGDDWGDDSGDDWGDDSGDGWDGSDDVEWYGSRLTWYTSYPDPNSEECWKYNGCQWAGYFAAFPGEQKEEWWVQQNNIAAVHEDDFDYYVFKTLRIRYEGRTIDAVVYDMCHDSDCDGCCTRNKNEYGFLIDLESYTYQRFGSPRTDYVEWYCVDC